MGAPPTPGTGCRPGSGMRGAPVVAGDDAAGPGVEDAVVGGADAVGTSDVRRASPAAAAPDVVVVGDASFGCRSDSVAGGA